MRLLKITSLETALVILRNGFRATQPDALNDKNEAQYFFDFDDLSKSYNQALSVDMSPSMISALMLQASLLDGVGVRALIRPDKMSLSDLHQYLRHPPVVTRDLVALVQNAFDRIRRNLGVVSLTEEINNMALWAHYGGNHTGCALELVVPEDVCFDTATRWPRNFFGPAFKVKYVDKLVVPTYDPQSVINVYISKLRDWGYEKEWRLFYSLLDDSAVSMAGYDGRGFGIFTAREPLKFLRGIHFGVETESAKILSFVEEASRGRANLEFYKIERNTQGELKSRQC